VGLALAVSAAFASGLSTALRLAFSKVALSNEGLPPNRPDMGLLIVFSHFRLEANFSCHNEYRFGLTKL
jgi:hypothetical protein